MYYVKGQGYFEREPLVTTNGLGQKSVLSSGVLHDADGRLSRMYDANRGDVGSLIAKSLKGGRLTPSEQAAVRAYRAGRSTLAKSSSSVSKCPVCGQPLNERGQCKNPNCTAYMP